MTKQEAISNIGKPFKWVLCAEWDIIRKVDNDGTIHGDFIEASAEDCRLKQPVPEQFKKQNLLPINS